MAKREQVIHNPDPQAKNEMPKSPHVFQRGSMFYVRKRVPNDLLSVIQRPEIRQSLGTSNRKEALAKAPYALAAIEGQFDEARRKAVPVKHVAPLKALSDGEIQKLAARWFIEAEKQNQTLRMEAARLPYSDLETVWDNLTGDITHYRTLIQGRGDNAPATFDPTPIAEFCLKEAGITLDAKSPSFERLAEVLRKALIETTGRQMDRIAEIFPEARHDGHHGDPHFQHLYSHTPPPTKSTALGELLSAFEAAHSASSAGTKRTYQIPIRLLRQHFGDTCPLSNIGPQEINALLGLLERMPRNAKQRYPGLPLEKAIESAFKAGDSNRLGPKTLKNYYNNIVAIFSYGVEFKMLPENPASSRRFRERFKHELDQKPLFTTEELQTLFNRPLFTGCLDDGAGYNKPGTNTPRRGRFWVPLLALFHGLRCNEACQLYTEDVRKEDGIWFIWIRQGIDGKPNTEKILKTSASERKVPVHQKAIDMGFIEFVKHRGTDPAAPRLFPELSMDTKGYYSGPFSKWFGRFKKKTLPECKASLHSFRHHWRTQLGRAGISLDVVEQLGGWTSEGRSSERHYHHGHLLPALRAANDRAEYEGLDLSHLCAPCPTKFPKRKIPFRS